MREMPEMCWLKINFLVSQRLDLAVKVCSDEPDSVGMLLLSAMQMAHTVVNVCTSDTCS